MPLLNAVITGGASAAPSFDASLLDTVFTIVEKCMSLLTVFPMNLILAGSLCGIGFRIFRKAKSSVH